MLESVQILDFALLFCSPHDMIQRTEEQASHHEVTCHLEVLLHGTVQSVYNYGVFPDACLVLPQRVWVRSTIARNGRR